jgi:hypothetical protein
MNDSELGWKSVQRTLSSLVTAFGENVQVGGEGVLIILPGTKHKLRALSNLKTHAAYWRDIWTPLPVLCCRAKSVVLDVLWKWKHPQASNLRHFPHLWIQDVLTQRSGSSVSSMSSPHWPECLWTNLLIQLDGKFCETLCAWTQKCILYLILLCKICKNKSGGLLNKGFNCYEFKSGMLQAVATWEPS